MFRLNEGERENDANDFVRSEEWLKEFHTKGGDEVSYETKLGRWSFVCFYNFVPIGKKRKVSYMALKVSLVWHSLKFSYKLAKVSNVLKTNGKVLKTAPKLSNVW